MVIAGSVAHLILNWRAFTHLFQTPAGGDHHGRRRGGAGAHLPAGRAGADSRRHQPDRRERLSGGQIETLAALAGSDTATVLAELGAAGIAAQRSDTPTSLSGGDRAAEMEIISTIFAH